MFEFRDVGVHFSGRPILDDFNLSIAEGEKVFVQGPSGSGKSTLIRLLLGFHVPDAGSIFFGGKPLRGAVVRDVRRRVAYVGQEFDLGEGPVEERFGDVFHFKANQHLHITRENIIERLEQFRLSPDILTQDTKELSRGETQRLALASGCLLDRSIFLLDEPTSALDREMKEATAAFFIGQKDWTVVVVSHDPQWSHGGGEVRTVSL